MNKKAHQANIKSSIKKVAIDILKDILICLFIIAVGNSLFYNRFVKALYTSTVQQALLILAIIVLMYEIRYGRKLCSSLDDMDALLKLEIAGDQKSLLVCNRKIKRIKKSIDIYKQKMSIMTSLSPLPITVLIIGFLIDKSKYNNLLWNHYTILIIVFFLFYGIELYRSFDDYRESQYQLLKVEKAKEEIKIALKENKSRLANISK